MMILDEYIHRVIGFRWRELSFFHRYITVKFFHAVIIFYLTLLGVVVYPVVTVS